MQPNTNRMPVCDVLKEPEDWLSQVYSVEFPVEGLQFHYQFKIWKNASKPLFVLIKEGSAILSCLRTGDVLDMKFYSTDRCCPTLYKKTKIKEIAPPGQNQYKGHFLVDLDIIESCSN